jgi:hypothetical protein
MPNFKVEMDNCSAVTISGKKYPILVNYLRRNAPKTDPTTPTDGKQKGRPFGVIVALGRDRIGWSLCHNIDTWDREEAIKRAAGRAMRGVDYWIAKFLDYTIENKYFGESEHIGNVATSGLPKLAAVLDGLREMQDRAFRYFKDK